MKRGGLVAGVASVLFVGVALYAALREVAVATAEVSAGPMLPPADPGRTLRETLMTATTPDAFRAAALDVRRGDALDAPAFILIGQAHALAGRFPEASAAFRHGKRADPRSSAARLGLIDALARSGEGQPAVEETFALLALRGDLDASVMPLILMVAADPEGMRLVLASARRHPIVAERLLSHASGAKGQEPLVRALIETAGMPADRIDAAIGTLAGRGQLNLAYALWTGGRGRPGVFDGAFERKPRPRPLAGLSRAIPMRPYPSATAARGWLRKLLAHCPPRLPNR